MARESFKLVLVCLLADFLCGCARSLADSPFVWRWFELRGGDLCYYPHSHSTERIGVLTIENTVEIRPVKLSKKVKLDKPMRSDQRHRNFNLHHHNLHDFGIELEDRTGIVYSLCCATGDDQENWIAALNKALADLDGNGDKLVVRAPAFPQAASPRWY